MLMKRITKLQGPSTATLRHTRISSENLFSLLIFAIMNGGMSFALHRCHAKEKPAIKQKCK